MRLYLGIDIGTTRTKVGCLDVDTGRLVALHAARTPVEDDPWGGVRDADALLAVVRDLLETTLADPAVDADSVAGLSVGSVGEEVVLLDASGDVTGPVLTWHARHGSEAAAKLPLGAWSGLDTTFSVFKLAWLAEHRPDELARAVIFTGIADYVAHALAGTDVADVRLNVSHSARTGLFDPRTLAPREDVLPGLGIDRLRLPRLVPSGTAIGTTPGGLPVVAGGHDHWCGAFGSGVRAPGDVYISAGTSEAQFILVDTLPDEVVPDVDVGAFVVDGLRYLHRATPSGRIYQAWRDLLYPDLDDDTMWREVDALRGQVDPVEIDAPDGVVPLPEHPSGVPPAQLMAGLQAGLAAEAERTTARLERLAGREAASVTVAGVPAARAGWRRLRQDATPRPLRFVTEPEATVVGVALLAQLGVEGAAAAPIVPTPEGTA